MSENPYEFKGTIQVKESDPINGILPGINIFTYDDKVYGCGGSSIVYYYNRKGEEKYAFVYYLNYGTWYEWNTKSDNDIIATLPDPILDLCAIWHDGPMSNSIPLADFLYKTLGTDV